MPAKIFKTANGIFIDVARGKRNLSDVKRHQVQKAQKGNTCWYYALNTLRFHFGNQIDLKERQIEKIFSDHRRAFNEIESIINSHLNDLKNIEEILNIKICEDDPITLKIINNALSELKRVAAVMGIAVDENAKEFALFMEFISQNECNELINYIANKKQQFEIELYQNTLTKLQDYVGKNLDVIVSDFITKLINSVEDSTGEYKNSVTQLFEMEKNDIYAEIVLLLAARCYGLEEAAWDPRSSIQELMKSLEIYGPHLVHTFPYISFNMNECTQTDDSKLNWTICTPKTLPSSDENESTGEQEGHAILIVGVEKENEVDYIYFIDPTDASSPTENRIAYKISYEYFCSHLANIYGVSLTEKDVDKVNGPFAFHLPAGKYDQHHDFVAFGLVPKEFKKFANDHHVNSSLAAEDGIQQKKQKI